ncbi:hypothetical protein CBR_g41515, partial [Chara braunii]
DKINSFWEITKKELEDRKAELRNKDREMEEMEERHQVEIKVYKQKVKHLLYEHQNNITQLKADGEMALKLQHEEFIKRESELMKDKRALKQEMKEMELAHEDILRQLRMEHAKELTKLRQEFELNAKEMQQKYEKKMKLLRDDLELRRKQEIHEIEERKNTHINELMKKHEKAFTEIKNYYNDITHNNLDLIKTLKEDVAEMKKKEAANEKLMYEIAQENKRLSEPLTKALKEVEVLRKQLGFYEKDKLSLQQARARLLQTEKQLKNVEWEQEVLNQRWQKRATGKVSGNPSKITTDPLIDSRVIKEEKDREDLLWDPEAVREQAILEFSKNSTSFRSMLTKMEQTTVQTRTKAQAENKRTMENGKTQGIQEGDPKRRKTVDAEGKEEVVIPPADKEGEKLRTDSRGTGSEKTSEGSKGEGDSTATDSEEDLHRSLQWLMDYVEKVKREREHAFDIRAACLKHAERSQRSELAAVSLSLLVATGMLEGDGDLDARAYPMDRDRFTGVTNLTTRCWNDIRMTRRKKRTRRHDSAD